MTETVSCIAETGRTAQADFLHHMRGVIIYLGGRMDIADKLEYLDDISPSDVADLRQYTADLEEDAKRRLDVQHMMQIRVGHPA